VAVDTLLADGTKLLYSTNGTTYTELPDMSEIGSPGSPNVPDVDVTPLAGGIVFRQFRPGLQDPGEFTFKQKYNAARMTLLKGRERTSTWWRITYPDLATPSKFEFVGYPKLVNMSGPGNPDDELNIECTVKVTGAVTWTAGS
jgi:hypothetical protein